MRVRIRSMVAAGAAAIAVLVAAAQPWAHSSPGQTTENINIAAATMSGREYSVNNRNGNSVCGTFVPLVNGGENTGDLDNATGSYLAQVQFPTGATVTSLKFFINDGDADADGYVFLLRKRVMGGLEPATAGYSVMAEAHSEGAAVNRMRLFTDDTIETPAINTSKYMYFVEVVDCGIPEPYDVRVVYTTA